MAGGGELQRGLYELLVTTGLAERLSGVDGDLVSTRPIHKAEVANRVALHLSLQIERALRAESDTSRVDAAAAIVAQTLELLQREIAAADLADEALDDPPRLLHSVTTRRPDASRARSVSRPSRCSTPRCSPTHRASRGWGISCARRWTRPMPSTW